MEPIRAPGDEESAQELLAEAPVHDISELQSADADAGHTDAAGEPADVEAGHAALPEPEAAEMSEAQPAHAAAGGLDAPQQSLPESYRYSYLAELQARGYCVMPNVLTPNLAASGLEYDDLAVDASTGLVRPNACRAFELTAVKAVGVPMPGEAVRVLERRMRLCLYAGEHEKFRGNIAELDVADARGKGKDDVWEFVPRDGNSTVLVRSDIPGQDVSLYMELTIVAEMDVADAQTGVMRRGVHELVCAWVKLPITSEATFEYKTRQMDLAGGLPWDPAAMTPVQRKGMFGKAKTIEPVMTVKLAKVKRAVLASLAALPANVIVGARTVAPLVVYRELLADELLRSDAPAQRAPTNRPALAVFPRISEQPDLFAYFQIAYERALGQLRKAEQQDMAVRKQIFDECCLAIWPMLHAPSKERWTEAMGETPAERERHLRSLVAKTPQALLLENVDANAFQPFNMQELTYDLFQ